MSINHSWMSQFGLAGEVEALIDESPSLVDKVFGVTSEYWSFIQEPQNPDGE